MNIRIDKYLLLLASIFSMTTVYPNVYPRSSQGSRSRARFQGVVYSAKRELATVPSGRREVAMRAGAL